MRSIQAASQRIEGCCSRHPVHAHSCQNVTNRVQSTPPNSISDSWSHSHARQQSITCLATCQEGAGTVSLQVSRRQALGAAGCLAWSVPATMPTFPQAAHAVPVEEDMAEQAFADAFPSVVAIALVRNSDIGEVVDISGSGVVWDSYGHIITNYRCISRAVKGNPRGILLELPLTRPMGQRTSTERYARVIGTDTRNDLAVLELVSDDEEPTSPSSSSAAAADGAAAMAAGGPSSSSSSGGREQRLLLPQAIKVAGSEPLKVGQSVFALGRAFSEGPLFSAGVVSGLNRNIPSPMGTLISGAVQTDAYVGPPGSGGPLVDSSGRLVGLAATSYSRPGGGRNSGVNFALPVSFLRDVVPKLILYGNPMGKRV